MDKVLLGILIVICVVIFWQDVRQRAVHWVLFLLLFFVSVLFKWGSTYFESLFYNALVLVFLLGVLTLYLTLKNGKLINITKGFFSWGDILFLVSILPLFETLSYVVFFTIGTIMSLAIHIGVHVIKPQSTVPYAGYMGIATIAYVFFESQLINLIYPGI